MLNHPVSIFRLYCTIKPAPLSRPDDEIMHKHGPGTKKLPDNRQFLESGPKTKNSVMPPAEAAISPMPRPDLFLQLLPEFLVQFFEHALRTDFVEKLRDLQDLRVGQIPIPGDIPEL